MRREGVPSNIEEVKVFDLDGVLLETALYERSQNVQMLMLYDLLPKSDSDEDIVVSGEFARAIDARMEEAFFESCGDPVRHYQILLGQTALGGRFRDRHRSVVEWNVPLLIPMPGAQELLRDLNADQITGVALWTSRDRGLLTPELTCGIVSSTADDARRHEGYFDITISADDVGVTSDGHKRMKPDEAGLEIISDYYSVPYDKITMVGDRVSDLTPAVKLGARAFGLASGYMRCRSELLWDAGATDVVTSLDDLRPHLFNNTVVTQNE
jgi:phosphoglycolate phosphatase-like HAD superfamily hydrolase